MLVQLNGFGQSMPYQGWGVVALSISAQKRTTEAVHLPSGFPEGRRQSRGSRELERYCALTSACQGIVKPSITFCSISFYSRRDTEGLPRAGSNRLTATVAA